jgi:hypothetical protein
MIITFAMAHPDGSYSDFLDSFIGAVDEIIGQPFAESDVTQAVSKRIL